MTSAPELIPFHLIKDNFENITTPFENDFWERKKLADNLTSYVERLNIGATIAINANWGSGKTWFLRHWQADLIAKEFKVVYLDAFTNDYLEDPFLLISMSILNQLKEGDGSNVESLKQSIQAVYRNVLPTVPKLLFSLFVTLSGAGMLAQSVTDTYEALKENTGDFGKELAEKLNENLEEHLKNQVDEYQKEQDGLDFFKSQLKKAAEELPKPIVFMIDELDRCRPEFSIRLIERIKHFFDIPNVVFVLAINKEQLEESINSYYGFTNKNAYLDKFIDFNIGLNPPKTVEYLNIIREYSKNLGISNIENDPYDFHLLCQIFKPNSRQLIKIMQKISFLNLDISSKQGFYGILFLICNELSLIKNIIKNLELLDILIEKTIIYLKDCYGVFISVVNMAVAHRKLLDQLMIKIQTNSLTYRFFALINSAYLNGIEVTDINILNDYRVNNYSQFNSINIEWNEYINGGFMIS